MTRSTKLVYSTDPRDRIQCPRCRKSFEDCSCAPHENVELSRVTVNIRLEKSGRGGKIVTVLDQLPKNEEFLKSLTKELKTRCGTGGTYRHTRSESVIEIQGDQRDSIKKILTAKQIKYKGM